MMILWLIHDRLCDGRLIPVILLILMHICIHPPSRLLYPLSLHGLCEPAATVFIFYTFEWAGVTSGVSGLSLEVLLVPPGWVGCEYIGLIDLVVPPSTFVHFISQNSVLARVTRGLSVHWGWLVIRGVPRETSLVRRARRLPGETRLL